MGEKENSVSIIGNLEINNKEGFVSVSVNPRIYSMDIIYSAAYVLIEKAYIVLDGDPDEEVLVEIRAKEKNVKLEDLGREFNNELITYALYKSQVEKNKNVRDAIVQRALLTNQQESEFDFSDNESEQPSEESEDFDDGDSYLDDPLGIAKPWEENN